MGKINCYHRENKMIKLKKKVIGYSNSIGIVIPKAITDAYGIAKGDMLLIDIIEITKAERPEV